MRSPPDPRAAGLALLVDTLPAQVWLPHPVDAFGEASVPLVSPGGTANLGLSLAGPPLPTPALLARPELLALLKGLGRPVARARLARMGPGGVGQVDLHEAYQRRGRARIVLPLSGWEGVQVQASGGEGGPPDWDSWPGPVLANYGQEGAIHLVIEVGPGAARGPSPAEAPDLPLEAWRFAVLEPAEVGELGQLIASGLERASLPPEQAGGLAAAVEELRRGWEGALAQGGPGLGAELALRHVLRTTFEPTLGRLGDLHLRPDSPAGHDLWTLRTSLLTTRPLSRPPEARMLRLRRALRDREPSADPDSPPPHYERPVFIVSAPRSGSTLLFEALTGWPGVWSIGGESHDLVEALPPLHPRSRASESNALTAEDATPEVTLALHRRFARALRDPSGLRWGEGPAAERSSQVRMVEKTPKNALRIPFWDRVFPDARFVFLHRAPGPTVASMVEGWRSERFVGYPELPGWPGPWSFLLIPGWRALAGRPVVEIAAAQWWAANATILSDLQALPPCRWIGISYEELVTAPSATLGRVAAFAGLSFPGMEEGRGLPLSSMTVRAPSPDRWREHAWQIDPLLGGLEVLEGEIRARVAAHAGPSSSAGGTTASS